MSGVFDRFETGRKIGEKYKLLKALDPGGCGPAFNGVETATKKMVHVRLYHPDDIPDAEKLELRIEGMKKAGALNPETVVLPVDHGASDGIGYAVYRVSNLRTFAQVFSSGKSVHERDVKNVVEALLVMCAKVHAEGLLCLGLSPLGVLQREGNLVSLMPSVIDFGLAPRRGHAYFTRPASVEKYLSVVSYVSPEQAENSPEVDHRADLYAVGALTYRLVTGRTPFGGASVEEILGKVQRETPAGLDDGSIAGTSGIRQFLRRSLEKSPQDRFDDASRMLEAFREAYGDWQDAKGPVTQAERRRELRKSLEILRPVPVVKAQKEKEAPAAEQIVPLEALRPGAAERIIATLPPPAQPVTPAAAADRGETPKASDGAAPAASDAQRVKTFPPELMTELPDDEEPPAAADVPPSPAPANACEDFGAKEGPVAARKDAPSGPLAARKETPPPPPSAPAAFVPVPPFVSLSSVEQAVPLPPAGKEKPASRKEEGEEGEGAAGEPPRRKRGALVTIITLPIRGPLVLVLHRHRLLVGFLVAAIVVVCGVGAWMLLTKGGNAGKGRVKWQPAAGVTDDREAPEAAAAAAADATAQGALPADEPDAEAPEGAGTVDVVVDATADVVELERKEGPAPAVIPVPKAPPAPKVAPAPKAPPVPKVAPVPRKTPVPKAAPKKPPVKKVGKKGKLEFVD